MILDRLESEEILPDSTFSSGPDTMAYFDAHIFLIVDLYVCRRRL